MKKALYLFVSAILLLMTLAGCGSDSEVDDQESALVNDEPIVVATMTDTEGGVLGKIIVLLLEDNNFKVDDQSKTMASTSLVRDAAVLKQADITLNYTGNGMYIMGEEGDKVWNKLQSGWERIRDYDLATNNLVWLEPCEANNTELLAVTQQFADENNIKDMYDFAAYVNNGGYLKLATPQYWVENEQGLPGLERAYGFEVTEDQLVIGSRAAKEVAAGTSGLNCTMVFTTDGILEELGLFVIPDPLDIPPYYAPTPIISKATLDMYPQIGDILNEVFPNITTEELVSMNASVLSKGTAPETVARDYLTSKGYID